MEENGYRSHVAASHAPTAVLIPFIGIPCLLVSVYDQFPECMGSLTGAQCCCFSAQHVCLKPTNRGGCRVLWADEVEVGAFVLVLGFKHQCCPFDARCSLPADAHTSSGEGEGNPCLLTLCFFTSSRWSTITKSRANSSSGCATCDKPQQQ